MDPADAADTHERRIKRILAPGTPSRTLDFCTLTPCYAQRVLYIGAFDGRRLAWRGHEREFRVLNLSILRRRSVQASPPYDFVVLDEPLDSLDTFLTALDSIGPGLSADGAICVMPRAHEANPEWLATEEAARAVTSRGLLLYTWVPRDAEEFPKGCALFLMRDTYDPVVHARALAEAGRPDWSILVLHQLPAELVVTEEMRARISAERLRHYVEIERVFGHAPDDFTTIAQAQKDFYIAVYTLPHLHSAYRNMAELWHRFGNDGMASRLLRSVHHAKPDVQTEQQCAALSYTPGPHSMETSPEWAASGRTPRILIITHDYSDYGMDTLYDGLCSVLGAENVTEFPWKATLHGERTEEAVNYPCVFDYPGRPQAPEVLEDALRSSRFDVVVFGDVVQQAYRDVVRGLLRAGKDTPVVVYDTWDNPHNLMPTALEYLGVAKVDAYFKREMLACCDYGPNAFPLPFGYPDRLVPEKLSSERTLDLFWAGKRLFGTRTLYLEYLDRVLGRRFDTRYAQAEYAKVLDSARIGLSFFGFGFDTVRYWELPAHGVMLLAERPPIRIPFDFEDGVNAVFFDDLAELEAKLTHYLAHPEEAERIARAGRDHFLRYHTAQARARQFLGRLEQLFGW